MAANFYSVRNLLESGTVRDNDKNNQFLAAVISSYPCLDIWVRVADDINLEVRILYIQKNQNFVATDSWERNNEEPKVWKQRHGSWDEIKAWLIGVLPSLSRLHDEKRNGLANFGQKNPYDGGGLVSSVNNADGTISILGRFGVLTVTIDGVVVPFSSFDWAFDGCLVQVTIDVGDDWTGGTIDDRPPQNTGGRNTNTIILGQGSFSYVMQGGNLDAFAPSGTWGFGGFAIANWPQDVNQNVPLGALTTVNPPTPTSNVTYGSTIYPSLTGQSAISLQGNCNLTLTSSAAGVNTYNGTLNIKPPFYVHSKGTCRMTYNGQNSTTESLHYASSGSALTAPVPGDLQITRSGNAGAYNYGITWTATDPASPVTAVFSTPTTSNSNGFSSYLSVLGPNGNWMTQALANSVTNGGTGFIQYSSLSVNTDTEGVLSTPPPNANFPYYAPPTDTGRLRATSWRHQLVCVLPA
tara:strand:+ start:2427 stop:3824 length:1398 start_codon:yes stop_codon:yes gene_type:complete